MESNRVAFHVIRTNRDRLIGMSKSWSIFSAIAQKSHTIVNVVKANHQGIFILGAGLTNYSERPLDMY